MDTDNGGELTLGEVVSNCDKLGLTPQEAEDLFKELDSDVSGTLTKDEAATYLAEYEKLLAEAAEAEAEAAEALAEADSATKAAEKAIKVVNKANAAQDKAQAKAAAKKAAKLAASQQIPKTRASPVGWWKIISGEGRGTKLSDAITKTEESEKKGDSEDDIFPPPPHVNEVMNIKTLFSSLLTQISGLICFVSLCSNHRPLRQMITPKIYLKIRRCALLLYPHP